jgi:acyl-CoA synthetase (AMP-forming)/AMP-acid ligase II/thioesterase domain-containing protein/acyl carrier protein
MVPHTIAHLITAGIERNPTGVALAAPGREALAYRHLLEQTRTVSAALNDLGAGRGARIATLLPSGPETAVLSLAVMSHAALAPLNPDLTPTELERDLGCLGARALVVPWNLDSPALGVAQRLGLSVVRLRPRMQAPAGVFDLDVETHAQPADAQTESDVALVLQTSGTTSTPKIVPLTHRNLCNSAANIARSLRLRSVDCCLNVMPLFHVHGLIGALLASIGAGATVVCPPGFIATEFFDWMDEFAPTWYTAVPTIHQAVLARAARNASVIQKRPLRFIRSCSAAMPEAVARDLIETFHAPVVEAYGMTEAAHQLAISPLPPGAWQPGCVGRATGPQLAIMDQSGRLLGPLHTGEIVARGESIMRGYENNSSANAATFTDGWLRTGDLGHIDADGYVFITGRIKELINRAGEKIAPREIEDALLTHPAVAQAVAFAVPDPKLGEEPAAAIALRPGTTVDSNALRAHAATRLAPFKVPRVVKIVDDIPKGPTGKPQRSQLARHLGLLGQELVSSGSTHCSGLERRVTELWASVLGISISEIAPDAHFTDVGGDSVLAVELVAQVPSIFGKQMSLLDLFDNGTVEKFAAFLEHAAPAARRIGAHVVPIQNEGQRLAVFAVHGVYGDVAGFAELARELGPDQPVYGLQAQGVDGSQPPLERIEDMASAYIADMREFQPNGPYQLIGYSGGGSIAFEMARQLHASGQQVGLLAVLDHSPYALGYDRPQWNLRFVGRAAANAWRRAPHSLRVARRMGWRKTRTIIQTRLKLTTRTLLRRSESSSVSAVDRIGNAHAESLDLLPEHVLHVMTALDQANRDYAPGPYAGSLLLLRCERQPFLCALWPDMGWSRVIHGEVVARTVPGSHREILRQPSVSAVAAAVRPYLGGAGEPDATRPRRAAFAA